MSNSIHAELRTATVHIELRPEAVVTERHVTLSDVAVVSANDSQLKDMLDALRVGNAPLVGYKERLSRAELDRAIRTRLAGVGSKAEWSGAKAVEIRSAGRLIDANTIVDAAKKHLLTELGSRFQSVEAQLASPVADIELPLGDLLLKPRPIDAKHVYSRLPVWVDMYVNGLAYRSVVVPFTVKASQLVYVTRRDLPEGALVSSDDFELRAEEVSSNAGDWFQMSGLQGSVRVKKPLAAGQVLMRSHVSQKDSVFRGDPVKLVLAEGGVVIEALALAQQEAAIGQLVKVKVEKGIDAIVGRVVAPGVVQAVGR